MKNRFKKTVEMEKMHYLGGEDIDDDAKKEKIDAMKLKINRMGTSLMMIQYLTKFWYRRIVFKYLMHHKELMLHISFKYEKDKKK